MRRVPVDAPALPRAPRTAHEAELRAFGESLGAALAAPVIVALRGTLGAGKTTLAQAIARGAGVEGDVTSPTFAIVHEYDGRSARVLHFDLYRVRDSAELTNIGWDDLVSSDAIVLVEWPERAASRLPSPRLDITLGDVAGDADTRTVEVQWTA